MVSDPVDEEEAGSNTVVFPEAQNETETAEYLDMDPAEEEDAGSSGAVLEAQNEKETAEVIQTEGIRFELPDTEPVDYVSDDECFSDDDGDANDGFLNVDDLSIVDGIRYRALLHNATHRSFNMILRLFRKANMRVPRTARSLLGTKRNASLEIVEIGSGQFWYNGIATCLLNYFCTAKPSLTQLSLTISIDGLPLHNNSTMQF